MEAGGEMRENKMGVMPINKLLISMSLPIMLSMVVQALYNIVDSIFVSRIGENALTAVSLAFPIQNLMIAVGAGTGVGINALLSKSLGEKNFKEVNSAANNGILLAILSALAFMIFGIFFSRTFFENQTNVEEIIGYGHQYLLICCLGSIGIFGQITFERLFQSTGLTIYTMITQGAGAIINIILDPILIFGLFGLPRMEVAGAALATIIGQIIAMLMGLYLNIRKNKEITLQPRELRPRASTIKRIYAVGVPSIIMGSIGSVMVLGMNTILMGFTSTATAVFGVYFKLQSFIFMPVFGLNNGMIPILSYNYGAQNRGRMIEVIKLSFLYAISLMLLGFAAFQIFPAQLLSLFDASEDMIGIGVVALRTISYSFLLAGFCIICGTVCQALGSSILGMLVSVVRQLVVLLPTAYLLSRAGDLHKVWLAFPIAEVVAALLCAVFLRHIYNRVIRHVGAEKPAV